MSNKNPRDKQYLLDILNAAQIAMQYLQPFFNDIQNE